MNLYQRHPSAAVGLRHEAARHGCRYILARLEHTGSIRRGDRIWQLGFGGGFKCNSAVRKARRDVSAPHPCWE